jgi:hypothetical protein
MPIELDVKHHAEVHSPKKPGEEKPGAVENETPPFSAVTHITIDNMQFVIKLCPGRHNPDKPRKKPQRGPDGKVVKPMKPCADPACSLRAQMVETMLAQSERVRARAVDLAKQLAAAAEERAEAEFELEQQKQFLNESEQRHELLAAEEKELAAELEAQKQAEKDGRVRIADMESERQRLARIVFENKLRQKGPRAFLVDSAVTSVHNNLR